MAYMLSPDEPSMVGCVYLVAQSIRLKFVLETGYMRCLGPSISKSL